MALVNLDFNLEDVKDNFQPLPADDYAAKIVSQELKTSSNGNPMIAIVWEITDGEFTGRKMFDNMVLIESMGWKIKQYAELLGMTSGSSLDPALLEGVEAILKIIQKNKTPEELAKDKAAGRDENPIRNEIKKIIKMG